MIVTIRNHGDKLANSVDGLTCMHVRIGSISDTAASAGVLHSIVRTSVTTA